MGNDAPQSAVIVVGGGASGLSTAGALARRGISAVVLEQDGDVGGTWARRYDRLHLHTVRRFSGLAHFPIPSRYPQYLSRDDVVAYLKEYARHFALRVVTGTSVQGIRAQGSSADGWALETAGPAGAAVWQGRVVVIATGQYRQPVIPPWSGRESYAGRLAHSVSYSNAAPYVGQRVLVVGPGNSGAEIATDLSDNGAASVVLSVRTPPPIVPRDLLGQPIQRTSILLSALPPAIANRLGWAAARLTFGDLRRYGMPMGEFAPYTTKRVPLINVGFVEALKRGRVAVKPALERLTQTGAVFSDGTSEPFDAIIAATGFTPGLEWLDDVHGVPGVLNDLGEPRGTSGEPTGHPGLYFVGFTHSLRGHLFEANLASRRLARHVARYLSSPR
ncbi:MAG TPA: NAD(P)/FAD-dependent oxidoreductase [Vicinamibacterales bacterium]|nr:NAD(P)/FAD-dependent oxidoreductase [Vicinamibacterales bacterium]